MIRLPIRKVLLCFSIGLNALCAGGMFTFPLVSSIVGAHCKLSQPQLTTIVLAGMMSQYTVAAIVGWVIDQHGPSFCSLFAALLFALGFGGFSWEVYKTPEDILLPLHGAFYRFTFFFFFVGLGTVFGYFSSLFAASKTFPNHTGLASGTSMALFGLSPLFFSVIASKFFTDPASGILNVANYTAFIALFNSIIYIAGFVFLRQIPCSPETQNDPISLPENETTPLLTTSPRKNADPTIQELLKRKDFWLLGIFCLLTFGLCEMIISNIGTIIVSLPSSEDTVDKGYSTDSGVAFQVNLISGANTVTRILVGPLADFVSPIAAYLPSGTQIFLRKHRISRFVFLSLPAILMAFTSLWMVLAARTRNQMWALSLSTGLSYSSVFTILPSLTSCLWGTQNMGRNFGLMMYAPFTGTPLFSYIYAFISARHTRAEDAICSGRACWRTTFVLSTATSLIALLLSFVLWKRWNGKI